MMTQKNARKDSNEVSCGGGRPEGGRVHTLRMCRRFPFGVVLPPNRRAGAYRGPRDAALRREQLQRETTAAIRVDHDPWNGLRTAGRPHVLLLHFPGTVEGTGVKLPSAFSDPGVVRSSVKRTTVHAGRANCCPVYRCGGVAVPGPTSGAGLGLALPLSGEGLERLISGDGTVVSAGPIWGLSMAMAVGRPYADNPKKPSINIGPTP
jgi:hypothetical protein